MKEPTMDLLDLDRKALEVTRAFVHGTTLSQLGLPTPCAEWDVRALLNHVLGNNHLYAAAASREEVDWSTRDHDRVGDDPHGSYDRSAALVTAAFDGTDLAGDVHMPFGVLPAAQAVAVHFVDVLVHGWDLAVGTGQHPALPDDLAEAALGIVAAYPPEVWGTPQFFADKVPVQSDDPPYVRLVALVGRQP
jgi:uncharacterized protein (TIGR03086 family)